ncbi:hypothetical protein [Stackebrandtia nassauensis]|uniref:Uncharacterized protein n=1 Tax=Stackebrandtia nassauensis (strain DSM 44728 / CIP 108903 / NRRL B-16338 / NBRC 102104 / LLR-40K-21) TaxID=446470 RepID=D3Q0I8_STANL|nr:hypothetical protein [Stackebrandtia nassauensis]ADD41724.1 hypothetical protein Snas_2029 [Stackebrandtia nassauensis DSM 44728]
MSILAQPLNPGPSAELYSSLAAVLAGFAFTGLMLFLNYQFTGDAEHKYQRIKPATVVMTLFSAMSSLTICAFLYGRAAGETVATGRTFLMLALYGVVLSPAVLSLFYALNLVMVSRPATARTAVDTRWVVAAVGPAVVMSLLADLLATAWDHGCEGDCAAWLSPRLWGFLVSVSFLVFGLMTSLLAARNLARRSRLRPLKILVWRFLNLRPVAASAKFFRRKKSAPAYITLLLTFAVSIFSLWARGIPDGFNPRYWTHALLGFAALVMGVFAFAAGSVLDEPVLKTPEPRTPGCPRSRPQRLSRRETAV